MADHRLPIRCGEIELFARALAAAVGVPVQSKASGVPDSWLKAVARDLQNHRGSSLILAGPSQPPTVHALAHAMNATLGNVGQNITYTDPIELSPETDSLPELAKEIEAGKVSALFILGSNPVFTAPADLQFAQLLLKVPLRIHCGLYDDETAELCHWHIPQAHFLESWSDARAYDGTVGIVQPLIAPLYGGGATHEIFWGFLGRPGTTSHDLVHDYWKNQKAAAKGQDFEVFWQSSLEKGLITGTALPPKKVSLRPDFASFGSLGADQPGRSQSSGGAPNGGGLQL